MSRNLDGMQGCKDVLYKVGDRVWRRASWQREVNAVLAACCFVENRGLGGYGELVNVLWLGRWKDLAPPVPGGPPRETLWDLRL
jgi:hypothetical protein